MNFNQTWSSTSFVRMVGRLRGGAIMADDDKKRRAIPWQLTGAVVAGVLAIAAYAASTASFLKIFVILFMLGGAAFLVGALVGFLFGIPKSRTDGVPQDAVPVPTGSEPREKYWDNANLEEVSDWLTKIIVGLGLVEFARLGDFFGSLGTQFDPVLEKPGTMVLEGAILYFLLLGFLMCYIWTRVVFYRSLVDVNYIKKEIKKEVAKTESKLTEEFHINTILNDLFLALDVNNKVAPNERNWSLLTQLFNQANEIFQNDKLHRKAAVLTARYICEMQNKPPLGNAAGIRRLDEFLSAKKAANQIDRDYADVLFNRSCCSAELLAVTTDLSHSDRLRRSAFADLKEAIRISPATATDAETDPDFVSVRDDPEFKRILEAAAT